MIYVKSRPHLGVQGGRGGGTQQLARTRNWFNRSLHLVRLWHHHHPLFMFIFMFPWFPCNWFGSQSIITTLLFVYLFMFMFILLIVPCTWFGSNTIIVTPFLFVVCICLSSCLRYCFWSFPAPGSVKAASSFPPYLFVPILFIRSLTLLIYLFMFVFMFFGGFNSKEQYFAPLFININVYVCFGNRSLHLVRL